MRDNDSLAKLYREFGDKWAIEPIAPGTRWIAVHRENGGEDITILAANWVSSLRHQLAEAEREDPADP
jgi:hypothetical protein